jgi:hypothetical protein
MYHIFFCMKDGRMGRKFGEFTSKESAKAHLKKLGIDDLYHEIRKAGARRF